MTRADYYRLLSRLNKCVADGRDRVAAQELRVVELADRAASGSAVSLLRILDRSLRVMIQRRALVIDQLVKWPADVSGKEPRR